LVGPPQARGTTPTNSDGIPDLLSEPGHEYQSRPEEELLGGGDEFGLSNEEQKRSPSFASDKFAGDNFESANFESGNFGSDNPDDAPPATGAAPAFDAAGADSANTEIDENSPWRQKPGLPAFPSTQHIHARRQRPPSNPVAELAKIVGGGAAGLLLGYFIVLWGLKVDLLHIAKHLPSFMVPEVLRAPDTSSAKNNENNPAAASTDQKWNPYAMPQKDGASSAPKKPPVNTPDVPLPELIQPNELKPAEAKPIEQKSTELKPNETAQATSLSADASPSKMHDADLHKSDLHSGDFPPPPELQPEPPLVPEGPKAEKTFGYSDAAKAMSAATDAAAERNAAPEDLAETNSAEFNRLRKTYYVALAKLAETVTMLRPQPHDEKLSTARHAAAALVLGLADDEAKQQELGVLASAWLASAKRTDIGIVLAGVAQKPEAVGKQYRTLIRLYGNSKPIAVLTSTKPELTDGNPVLVLGVIVDDPAKNLNDYQGDDERVVWAAAAVDPTHSEAGDLQAEPSDSQKESGPNDSHAERGGSSNTEPMVIGL
jgi:hypothetical protein